MAERYQTSAKKSMRKFEVGGERQLVVRLPLPLVEVREWEHRCVPGVGLRLRHRWKSSTEIFSGLIRWRCCREQDFHL
jgi:hypothetical protein